MPPQWWSATAQRVNGLMKKTKTFLVIEQFFFVSLYDLVLNFLFERSIEKTNRLLSNKILDRKNTRIIIAGWKECLVQAFRFFSHFLWLEHCVLWRCTVSYVFGWCRDAPRFVCQNNTHKHTFFFFKFSVSLVDRRQRARKTARWKKQLKNCLKIVLLLSTEFYEFGWNLRRCRQLMVTERKKIYSECSRRLCCHRAQIMKNDKQYWCTSLWSFIRVLVTSSSRLPLCLATW